jgi:hypothetical protein
LGRAKPGKLKNQDSISFIEKLHRKTTCGAALRWSRWNMERSGLNSMFRDRPSNAIGPSGYDLWNLYRTVRSRKPRTVLEIGVGCSTLVLAEAVARNRIGHVFTADASQHWIDVTLGFLPEEDMPLRLSQDRRTVEKRRMARVRSFAFTSSVKRSWGRIASLCRSGRVKEQDQIRLLAPQKRVVGTDLDDFAIAAVFVIGEKERLIPEIE